MSDVDELRRKWNAEFLSGRWDFLRRDSEQRRLQVVAGMIAGLARRDGALEVVDLGSGEGHLLRWLVAGATLRYVAVDISDTALRAVPCAAMPVHTCCCSLAQYRYRAREPAAPTVLAASEVLYFDDDSVQQLARIAADVPRLAGVIVSAVGPHPRKPNWAAASRRVWDGLDALGWCRVRHESVRDADSGVQWDVVLLDPAPP